MRLILALHRLKITAFPLSPGFPFHYFAHKTSESNRACRAVGIKLAARSMKTGRRRYDGFKSASCSPWADKPETGAARAKGLEFAKH